MYIVCTEYTSFTKALRDLEDADIRHAQYYTSAMEDLGCVMAVLSTDERHRLENKEHSSIEYILIMPLGNIRKLDASLMFGISWMQHAGDESKKTFIDWITNEHPIISYLDGSILPL